MINFLAENPLFLLFLVIALGYPFGRLSLAGMQSGIATTLFAGLAVGAIDERLRLPNIIVELGLVIFVYTIGLSSGREFARSLRLRGAIVAVWTIGAICGGAAIAALAWSLLELEATETAGLFAGAMTNTPALAGVLDYIAEHPGSGPLDDMLAAPVVTYSITYPMGVFGAIVAIAFFHRRWNIDLAADAERAKTAGFEGIGARLRSVTIEVTNPAASDATVEQLTNSHQWELIFGRLHREGETRLITGETILKPGDLVTMIGEQRTLQEATEALGVERSAKLDLSRESLDYRRIFVSNPAVAGQRLRDLNLPQNFGAIVTRVRRGDIEFLPNGDTVLEPGDRVRVVTSRENMSAVTSFFGDSYRALSQVDILTFSVGIAIGLGIGAVPIPLPGGIEFRLGIAGGPLVVALILGALERTGRLVWTIPYSANLTLRQLGLMLFLAGIGVNAGYAFRDVIGSGHGLALLAAGAVLTTSVAFAALWTARRVLNMPMGVAIGMLAGLQTQPAVLSYAQDLSGDELPTSGYAMVFPLAMIAKIVVAQILLASLL